MPDQDIAEPIASPLGITEDFESLAGRDTAPAKANLDVKLEGDDVPELLRGKTMKEALGALTTTLESFRGSEKARKELEDRVSYLQRMSVVPAKEEPKPAAEPPKYTKEQLDELHKTDPIGATAIIVAQAMGMMNANLDARLKPLSGSAAAAVEQQKRTEYAAEFEDFGDQIDEIAKNIPDKSTLSNPASWDQIISYVRGKKENFAKLVAREAKRAGGDVVDLGTIRRAAGDAAPANLSTGRGSTPKGAEGGKPKWSAEEDRVRVSLGTSVEDWEKYR